MNSGRAFQPASGGSSRSAATNSALTLLTEFGVVILPGVLAYQAYSYFVFRRRVSSERVH